MSTFRGGPYQEAGWLFRCRVPGLLDPRPWSAPARGLPRSRPVRILDRGGDCLRGVCYPADRRPTPFRGPARRDRGCRTPASNRRRYVVTTEQGVLVQVDDVALDCR